MRNEKTRKKMVDSIESAYVQWNEWERRELGRVRERERERARERERKRERE